MKVDLLNKAGERFAEYLESLQDEVFFFKWECQRTFRKEWNLGADDFGSMYDRSLRSSVSTRLWEGSKYSGKSAMTIMAHENPEFCRSMFRDLFNVEKDINQRASRFAYHCDELRSQLNQRIKILDHHHDIKLISLYLAFHLPADHCYFEPNRFAVACHQLGLKNPPAAYEFDRFLKLAKTVSLLLRRSRRLIEAYPFDTTDNLLLVHDFYEWLSKTDQEAR